MELNDAWRQYPYGLVDGDDSLVFPAAEGLHPGYESDTWFVAGELSAQSGRRFAFLTIVNKNRIGGSVVADFYTMALFDIDTGEYGTYTDYDMPPKNLSRQGPAKLEAAVGHLDITYRADAGTVTWRTCRDEHDALIPYTYEVELVGTDHHGQAMALQLDMTPTRAPVPVGASTYDGRIVCFGQDDTYSYFQTGMSMTGTLTWGEVSETVSGTAGHIDRQWFPSYANGGGNNGDPRARSHEWRTINLDNGVDMSIWRQFDRTRRNEPQPFSGATTSSADPGEAPQCAEDIEVTTMSYVRWPEEISTLIPPQAAVRFLPDLHRITSETLQLDLLGTPLVPVPAHALPIEYMEGPYHYRGTLRGSPVAGFAFFERSLALYQDWELADALTATLAALAQRPTELLDALDGLRAMIAEGRHGEASDYIDAQLRPGLADLTEAGQAPAAPEILDALAGVLSEAD